MDPVAEARQFCDIYGIEGNVLVDATGSLPTELAIRGVPCNVVVDGDGTVQEVGATTTDELTTAITRLLGRDDW